MVERKLLLRYDQGICAYIRHRGLHYAQEEG